jgi:polyphosphate kinase
VRNPKTGTEHFARVKVPPIFSRFVPVGNQRFVPLEDVIGEHLKKLFPGMEVLQAHTFRVTRNEDLEVEEDDAENLLKALEKELLRRRFGPPVRLEVEESMDPTVLDLLVSELGVSRDEVSTLQGPLDLRGLHSIADLPREDLKYPAFLPVTHPQLAEVETAKPVDVFDAVRRQDVLLHHPYDSFATSVQRFLEQAAADPHVLAIKQTLYRTSGDSPIIDALVDAAEAGKQVLVIVEIKARFDESNNIRWARKLEHAGCHVVYGLVGLKTHCKLSMVVRDEPDGIRRYTHIGTGNYNPKTARLYEDLGLLTADPAVGEDVAHLFNNLSGISRNTTYDGLLVAPDSVRDGLIAQIHAEVANHQAGRESGIRIKANSIVDEAVIDALYLASQAGVKVELLIRGICALRPGVPGLSETIHVRSVLGRFLEHSRVFWFANAGEPLAWIGSADMMHRNLDRRVEVLVRLPGVRKVAEVGALLDLAFDPDTSAWELDSAGTWTLNGGSVHLQETLIARQRRRR